MSKFIHEIRDPIHNFIRLNNDERTLLDSRPLQRLRHIHQLALTFQVYPGASHKRFEHSLGVMELATRAFDVITNPNNVTDKVRAHFLELRDLEKLSYWRKVLRMAALCHDVGHLPYSHAAEHCILAPGMKHEHITMKIIASSELQQIFLSLVPPINPTHVLKLAVGKSVAKDEDFSDWERILSNIIADDNLGVDRIDYLLRDSHHIGVAYGKFDHFRLIDCLRILIGDEAKGKQHSNRPELGIDKGGIHAVEALNLARYYMFKQVYLHAIRRIYDIHLTDFLVEWLSGKRFGHDTEEFLNLTDSGIHVALHESLKHRDASSVHAERVVNRNHFKVVYSPAWNAAQIRGSSVKMIYGKLCDEFSKELLRLDHFVEQNKIRDFPVLVHGDETVSSIDLSELLGSPLNAAISCIYADGSIYDQVAAWLSQHGYGSTTESGKAG